MCGSKTTLDARAIASAVEVSRYRQRVRRLGSLLMREHEVVLRRFEGSEAAVHSAAERAAIPYERILEVSVIATAGRAGEVRSAPRWRSTFTQP